MSRAIEAQFQTFESDATAREHDLLALKKSIRHNEAEVAASVEAVVASLLQQYHNIAALSQQIAASAEPIRQIWAPKVMTHFRKLVADAKEIREDIQRVVKQGYEIAGLREFLDAISEVEIVCANADRWLQGLSQLNQGKGLTLTEAMDELRRRASADRA